VRPEGRTDVHDEPRSRRPSSSDDVVAKVQRILLEDRRITKAELALWFPDVSEATIYRIVTENLGYHKVCARSVPDKLTAEHKHERVDCARMFLEEYEAEGDEFLMRLSRGMRPGATTTPRKQNSSPNNGNTPPHLQQKSSRQRSLQEK